jgi:hypothetical protein
MMLQMVNLRKNTVNYIYYSFCSLLLTKKQKETRLFLTSILSAILAVSTLAMVTNVNNEEHQVFAQNMTQTEGEGIPFVIQGTAQSTPDIQAAGHEPYHQIAMVLPERQDVKYILAQ